jgi:capsular polysaccharide biosynthesis protein
MIYPEDYSLAKQVAAFSQAEAVLGPHGAGLLNAIYGENTTLIELFGERTNPCFFAIADALEMPYFMARCEPIGVNLRVDPNRLQELLEIALNS